MPPDTMDVEAGFSMNEITFTAFHKYAEIRLEWRVKYY